EDEGGRGGAAPQATRPQVRNQEAEERRKNLRPPRDADPHRRGVADQAARHGRHHGADAARGGRATDHRARGPRRRDRPERAAHRAAEDRGPAEVGSKALTVSAASWRGGGNKPAKTMPAPRARTLTH